MGQRGIAAKGAMVVGLIVLLVTVCTGGWMLLRTSVRDTSAIVVGTTSSPTLVDPGGAWDAASWELMGNVYQSLLTFAPGQEQPVPDAAEHCEFTDTQLTVFRCTVRDDLRFSNGHKLTPDDVKFSFERVLTMAERARRDHSFQYAGPAGLLSGLEAVRVDGRHVIFELKQPDATFPFVIATSAGAIVDRHEYPADRPRTDNKVVASGPYLLTRFEKDEYAELVPNPNYEGAVAQPQYGIRIRYFVADEEGPSAEKQLVNAWERGELDVNDGRMPPERVAQLNASSPDYRYFESNSGSIRVLAFDTDSGQPIAHEASRQVAAAVLDREEITRHVQRNTVKPLYSLIPAGFTGHGTPFYDRYAGSDPDDLRQQLVDAGLDVPVTFDLAYSRGSASNDEAKLIERQLEADGLFDVDIEYQPWSDFTQGVSSGDAYDAYLIGWRPDFPDPATFTDEILGPVDGLNTGYSDGQINRLVEATRRERDRARTARDFREIHTLGAEAAPVIPIWQEKAITISRPNITGIQYLSDRSGLWRLWELSRI